VRNLEKINFKNCRASVIPISDPYILKTKQVVLDIMKMYGIDYKFTGLENLPPSNCIIAANHVSLIEGPLIFATPGREVVFISKKEVFDLPFVGFAMHRSGFIAIDRRNPPATLFKKVKEKLLHGKTLAIFPEGTRSPDGKLRTFKKGFARFAAKLKVPVIPCAVIGAHKVLPKGKIVPRPGSVELRFMPAIFSEDEDEILYLTKKAIHEAVHPELELKIP